MRPKRAKLYPFAPIFNSQHPKIMMTDERKRELINILTKGNEDQLKSIEESEFIELAEGPNNDIADAAMVELHERFDTSYVWCPHLDYAVVKLRECVRMRDHSTDSFERIADDVLDWAEARGLISPNNTTRQMLKVMEEVGELAGGVAKNNGNEIRDAIGDVMVTLVILSAQLGYAPVECFREAYDTIKNRTGVTKNGVFIKD